MTTGDTSKLDEAVPPGINWAPKLAHALVTASVQHAHIHRSDEEVVVSLWD
jgi:hypothetical protein